MEILFYLLLDKKTKQLTTEFSYLNKFFNKLLI